MPESGPTFTSGAKLTISEYRAFSMRNGVLFYHWNDKNKRRNHIAWIKKKQLKQKL